MKTYAVVIPVYNERELAPKLLARLDDTPPAIIPERGRAVSTDPRTADAKGSLERLIIVVDDASTDGTRPFVESLRNRPGYHVVLHPNNRGKGAAVRAGFARAIELGADVLLIQDADLEYDPADHQRVLEPILDGRADVVFGSRFLGETHRVLYYWHYAANRLITLLCNMATNLNLTDIECCFKAMRREVAETITIEEDRFGIEPELVAKVSRVRLPRADGGGGYSDSTMRARVYEVAVSYSGRTYEEGKKITWRDGVRALVCIFKYGVMR
ncbi:MAG: glycosyltransferase family 2 protein [Phycisphaerales bacterium]|nr:glycosyltransferase family 2 protein [Phycisphaerales bacterium]